MMQIDYHWLSAATAPLLDGTEMFDGPILPESLAAYIAEPNHHMVFAVAGGAAIGFASGSVMLHPDKPPAFFISEVGVNEAHRKQGIAFRLTDALIARARAIGCKGIWLATELENAPARALYAKLAARETSDIVVYDWDGAMDENGVE